MDSTAQLRQQATASKHGAIPPSQYERNVVFRSSLTGQFYFAPKVRVLSEGVRCVVGRKYDITEHVAPFLLKKFRPRGK